MRWIALWNRIISLKRYLSYSGAPALRKCMRMHIDLVRSSYRAGQNTRPHGVQSINRASIRIQENADLPWSAVCGSNSVVPVPLWVVLEVEIQVQEGREPVWEIIREAAKNHGIEILEIFVMPNHVHLVVGMLPTMIWGFPFAGFSIWAF